MDFNTIAVDYHSPYQEAVSLLIGAGLLAAPLGLALALWSLVRRRQGLPRFLRGPAAILLIASGLGALFMLIPALFEFDFDEPGLLLLSLFGVAAWAYVLSHLRPDEIIGLRLGD
jgi:uncharacterized membrane protein